jgi:dTDP-4-amino-4,6-dideoxygalactose transaminase
MTTPIPFVDLRAAIAPHEDEYLAAIKGVLTSGSFAGGKDVTDFEAAFAKYCGAADCVTVSNGTEALMLALKGLGIGPGDEVITAANSFFATAEAISHAGARPVLADVRDDNLLLDVEDVARRITPWTKAIIPVHLFGQLADMPAILALAQKHEAKVLEDAAQAHGATLEAGGKTYRAGSAAPAAGFSFYPTKNLGAFGEGGAVTTSDPAVAASVRRLKDHGQAGRHDHQEIGYNARLNSITCACLSISLRRLDAANAARRERAARYRTGLAKIAGVRVIAESPGSTPVYHLMVIRVPAERRDAIRDGLGKQGIATAIHYPTPIHRQHAYAQLDQSAGSCPVAERAATEMISLPMYPELPLGDVDRVVDAIAKLI